MCEGKEATPMKHPKSASSVEEAPIRTTPYPDGPSSTQVYHGGAAPAAFYASTVGSPTPHPYMWRSQDPNLAPTSGEVGKKVSDGKGRTSVKKSKGASGSTSFAVDQGAQNQKVALSSDNDSPSLSSGNGVDGSLEVRSNPLGIAAPGATVVHDGMMPNQWVHDERELKRLKRKLSNRESARRSRLRKQAQCEELLERVEAVNNENHLLTKVLARLSEECEKLTSENNSLKEVLLKNCEPDDLAGLQRILQEAAGDF